MAPTLVATAGSASANSYITRADASTYLDAQMGVATWDAAADATKDRALIAATRELDTLPWIGDRTDGTQALAWPRLYALDPDRPYDADSDELYFASTVVPTRVQHATARLALYFVTKGTDDLLAADADAGLVRKKVDVLEKEFAVGQRQQGIARASGVMDLLSPLLKGTQLGGANIPMVRV